MAALKSNGFRVLRTQIRAPVTQTSGLQFSYSYDENFVIRLG